MRLWDANYSWEVDQEHSGYSILHPTLAEARSRAIELMTGTMRDNEKGAAEYADGGKLDVENHTLTVTISRVTVRRLDAEAVCQIINSNGCFWMATDGREQPVMTIAMKPYWKKPKTTKHHP